MNVVTLISNQCYLSGSILINKIKKLPYFLNVITVIKEIFVIIKQQFIETRDGLSAL